MERIEIWEGDITKLGVDAIVNAANSSLLGKVILCTHGPDATRITREALSSAP